VNYFVIVREDGKFVSRAGSEHSYTDKLQEARCFSSMEKARPHKCENEVVLPVTSYLHTDDSMR
jgi:hypothetical protein